MPPPDQAAGTPPNAPSLAVAINKYTVSVDYQYALPDTPDDPAQQKEHIKTVLDNIWLNLNAIDPEDALAGAWQTPEGTNPFAPKPPGLEERWARLITERLMGAPYNGPGATYRGDSKYDSEILGLFQRDSDPVCSLVFACQQLSSMGAMSRGFKLSPFFNAGGSQQAILNNLKVVDPVSGAERTVSGKWYPGPDPSLLEGAACYRKQWFGPGAVWACDGRNKGDDTKTPGPNRDGAHIVFMLRAHPDQRSFQVLDTGAIQAKKPELPYPRFRLNNTQQSVGNYDYGWTEKVIFSHPDVFQGLGVLPPESEAQSLAFGIRRMRRARPLGFARLILQRRTNQFDSNGVEKPGELIFATPMLQMHIPDEPEKNFSISRLLWSLRQVPGVGWLKATWLIFVPQWGLAETIIQQSQREWGLSATLDNHFNKGAGDWSKIPADWHTKNLSCILYLSSWCDRQTVVKDVWDDKQQKKVKSQVWKDQPGKYEEGTVVVEAIRNRDPKKVSIPGQSSLYSLPWNKPSGTVKLEVADFADFPYFMGDWDGL